MPAIAHMLARAKSSSSYRGGHNYSNLVSLIGFIPVVMIIIFMIVFFVKHRKAKKAYHERNIPYSNGKIALKAAVIAVTFGLIAICIGDCCGCDDVEDTLPVGGNEGSNVPTETAMSGPPPMQAPGMNWAPVNSAAMDGVQ